MNDDIRRFIDEMESNGTVIIRGFRSKPELLAELSAAIGDGKSVAFTPSQRSLRHFFNTQGFIASMEEIGGQLEGAENVVPAGLYGQQHVVGFRPVKQAAEA